MDQFGVLVDEYHGVKSHARSAPLSKLKQKPIQPSYFAPSSNNTSSSFVDSSSSPYDLDGFFTAAKPQSQSQQNYFGNDDIDFFAGVSISGNSAPAASNSYDDFLGLNSNNSEVVHDDVFGILGPKPEKTVEKKGSGSGYEDLLPGFGVHTNGSSNQGVPTKAAPSSDPNYHRNQPGLVVDGDPLEFFSQDKSNHSKQVLPDGLDDFFSNQSKSTSQSVNIDDAWQKDDFFSNQSKSSSQSVNIDDAWQKDDFFSNQSKSTSQSVNIDDTWQKDDFFGNQSKSTSQSVNIDDMWQKDVRKNATAQDTGFDFFSKPGQKPVPPPPAQTVKRSVVTSPVFNLWDDDTTSPEVFQEIDGEPRERRDARWKRYMRTKERMDEALAVKNQRDLESQYEQDEKRRLAETLEKDIKRWAAGKEGNLRALLSSLQQVLWPECGWRPVSLTDMITSDAVKKVYRKATLYVHPDKVQQKGANLQQKYIAEKVFDILKEAWNKFNSEELR